MVHDNEATYKKLLPLAMEKFNVFVNLYLRHFNEKESHSLEALFFVCRRLLCRQVGGSCGRFTPPPIPSINPLGVPVERRGSASSSPPAAPTRTSVRRHPKGVTLLIQCYNDHHHVEECVEGDCCQRQGLGGWLRSHHEAGLQTNRVHTRKPVL